MSKKRIPHGILYADGTIEVFSNDRELKIILSRVKVLHDGENVEAFRTSYFVKEGLEWEQTLERSIFKTSDGFIEAISRCNDFTQAISDIRGQMEE